MTSMANQESGWSIPSGLTLYLVEHQRWLGVAVELLERLDPGVNRRELGREHQDGRPRFHQATMVGKAAATIAATPARS